MAAILLRAGMALNALQYWRPVERMAGRPDLAQRNVLLRILTANRDTTFGRQHGFADIQDAVSFARRVPVQEYEALRPYIDEQRRTGVPSLTAEAPVLYAQTSGSTAAPKHIPMTATSLRMHRAEQALFSYLQFRACPQAFDGKAWGIMGAAVEDRLDSGHAVGSVSGHLYQSLPRSVQTRFVVPPIVSTVADYDLKYQATLCLALAEPAITYLGAPNPSTFLRLLAVLNGRRERLLEVVATGRTDALEGLPQDIHDTIRRRIRPNPARAALLGRESQLSYANTWPGIRLITTWTGGSCGIALDALRKELPAGAMAMELGYQATECRGTIALEPETGGGLPALHHHFFEFVEEGSWESGAPEFLTLDRLEPGRRYYVLVTTASGLYRYFMNDLLDVTGMFTRTPLLRFVQKGKGVTSLTGEKLYEAQAIAAVQQAARQLGLASSFFLLLADEQKPGYELLIELDEGTADLSTIAHTVDHQLEALNLEYHAKRASGRLRPLVASRLKRGAADAHRASHVRAGQREAQFKPVILQYRRDLRWRADEYLES